MMDAVPREWNTEQVRYLAETREMLVSVPRVGQEPRSWAPIWVVVAGQDVFVRTWYRRSTGWYGRAVASGAAWIRVADEPVRVLVAEVGSQDADAVDTAYRDKYGVAGAASMVTAEAAASTLRLILA